MQLFWVINKAVNFAERNLGPNDGITENLRNVYENARSELDPSFKKKKSSPKKKAAHMEVNEDEALEEDRPEDEGPEEEDEDRGEKEDTDEEAEGEDDKM